MKIAITILIVLAVGVVIGYWGFMKRPLINNQLNLNDGSTTSPSAIPVPSPTPEPTQALPDMVKVKMMTVRGEIDLELYPKVAPKTVSSFLQLTQKGFYDGTKFHRVIDDFMIQGGDPLSKTLPAGDPKIGTGGPDYRFEDEINPASIGVPEATIKEYEALGYKYDLSLKSLPVDPGYIAMANSGPNTNGSQFFIVTTKPQTHLYGKHTVFGKVVKGMDVALKIKQGDEVKSITIVQ